ncbi:unnamed protein product [Phytomonas sp. Hart1]|nr:unnamed protein product [Phytomonas sp. Hart1]|eukprot:CCW70645.1 unnamed protein product [Phytomonas sp. isolate Hart1]
MKRARNHAEAVEKLGRFLAIGAQAYEPGGFSLDRLMWERLFDELEDTNVGSGIDSLHADGLSAHAQVMALKHYHRIFATASSLVPLSLQRWEQWKKGLSTLCLEPASHALSSGEGRLRTSSFLVSEKRQALLLARDKAFTVNHWGTTWSAKVQLMNIEKECRDHSTRSLVEGEEANYETKIISDDNFRGDESHSGDMLARLTRLNFSILHGFSLLRFQSEHLYSIYASIGVVERSWLLDKLLANCEGSADEYEAALESIVRQSFKRDFIIPSCDIANGSLLKQYCDFEVDKKRRGNS